MKRTAKAIWTGDLKTGHGELSTESKVLNGTQYSFHTRFAEGTGTNPEELIAAAHAGCFTMAISYALSEQGLIAKEMETTAVLGVDMTKGVISGVELSLKASLIDGLSESAFLTIAESAKENCLVSKALSRLKISLNVNYGNF